MEPSLWAVTTTPSIVLSASDETWPARAAGICAGVGVSARLMDGGIWQSTTANAVVPSMSVGFIDRSLGCFISLLLFLCADWPHFALGWHGAASAIRAELQCAIRRDGKGPSTAIRKIASSLRDNIDMRGMAERQIPDFAVAHPGYACTHPTTCHARPCAVHPRLS